MVERQTVFKYKTVKGLLHRVPAIIKLALFLPLSIMCLYLPSLWLGIAIFAFIIFAFVCGITIREQFTDFTPVFLYAALMFCLCVFAYFYDNQNTLLISDFLRITLRLTLIVQFSALLFRTTSSLEIREVVRLDILALFLCFIPEIFKTWSCINLAWKARKGKNGINKIKTLIFVLISISFEKAFVKAKAIEARRITRRK